jgi:serine/threonine protein kinase/TolA-binding protein
LIGNIAIITKKGRQTMGFREIKTPLEKSTQEEEKTRAPHFFSNPSPEGFPVHPSALDRGKGVLSPDEEEQLVERLLGEDGKTREKIVNLSNECTPDNPIGLGGMKSLKKFFGKGETSRQASRPASGSDLLYSANHYYNQGKYDEAELWYKRALERGGLNHSDTGDALYNLADIYCEQSKYDEAELWYKRALTIYEREDDHSNIEYTLNGLVNVYYKQGKYTDAEPLYKRALNIREQRSGPDHPDTAKTLCNLSNIYREQGKYADAEPLYKRALTIYEEKSGRDYPDTAMVLNNLGNIYYEQGKYADAEPLYKRALTIYEEKSGRDHPDTAMVLNNLGNIYYEQGKYADAEPLYKRALTIYEEKLGADHPDTAETLNDLAGLCKKQGKDAEAERLYKRALKIRQEKLGADHPDTAETLNDLAGLCKKQGKEAEARRLYTQALAIREQKLGPNHPKTVASRNHLANLGNRQSSERPLRNVSTTSSGEASSSQRAGELRSPEQMRPADRRTDSRRPDGERRVERQIGNYRLKEVLGSGSFAKVYLSENVDPSKPPAAVKVFKTVLMGPTVNEFFNEVQILKQLKHEHIIRIYDFNVTDDHYPFMAMELAPDGTLAQLHPLGTQVPYMQISNCLDQLGSGLDYAHGKNIVHRDLKPANLLVVKKPNGEIVIKIADFGLAKVHQNSSSQVTQEGIVGTFAYMPPEQMGGKAEFKSDQYSVGVMLYQWLSGHLPFEGATPYEFMAKHMMASPEPISGVAQAIQDVVFRALAKKPEDRFGSVTELAQAFKRAVLCEPGRQLLQSGQYKEALEKFNQILGLDAQNTFALASRGQTYQRLVRHEKASADYQNALALDSSLVWVRQSLNEVRQNMSRKRYLI